MTWLGFDEQNCLTNSTGKSEMQQKLEIATTEVNGKYKKLEEVEKSSLRQALIEERSRFCVFIGCLKPFVVSLLQTDDSHFSWLFLLLNLQDDIGKTHIYFLNKVFFFIMFNT